MEYHVNKRTNDNISVIGIGSSSISNTNEEKFFDFCDFFLKIEYRGSRYI